MTRIFQSMSESKSKIMSFRLSAELEVLASAAAASAGDKNASAWCQRLAIETLSKIGEANQDENAERPPEPAFVNDLFKSFDNLRRLTLDCFELSLGDKKQYKDFLNVIIASEEKWEMITQSVCKSDFDTQLLENRPTVAAESPIESEGLVKSESLNKQEKLFEDRIGAEEISDEYLSFAEEMKNEISELIGGEEKLAIFQNGRAIEVGEPAMKNQVTVVLPNLDVTAQTDTGQSF